MDGMNLAVGLAPYLEPWSTTGNGDARFPPVNTIWRVHQPASMGLPQRQWQPVSEYSYPAEWFSTPSGCMKTTLGVKPNGPFWTSPDFNFTMIYVNSRELRSLWLGC